jgi:pimeloyl-ACP methyl ester carboxylesterase
MRIAAATPAWEEHWLELSGGRMRYLKAGSGPALILIHGLMGYAFSWRFTIPALAPHATVYAIDNLGAGFSPCPDGLDCGLRATAERVLAFADALAISSFDLLGTSHGGGVAMITAAISVERQDPRLKRLILVAPINPWAPRGKRLAPFLAAPFGSFLFRHTMERWRYFDPWWLRRLFGAVTKIPPDSLEGYRMPVRKNRAFRYARQVIKTWTQDMHEIEVALPKISHYPTLLIWGSSDRAVSIESVEPLRRNFRDCRLAVFEGVGHLPYEEAPEEFNRTLVKFLSRPGSRE